MEIEVKADSSTVPKRAATKLIIFLGVTFSALWIPAGAQILFPQRALGFWKAVDLPPAVGLAIGALSPSLTGVVVTLIGSGWEGFCYIKRAFRWRAGLVWRGVAVLAISVFMTWVSLNTRGSVLLAGMTPHLMANASDESGIAPGITWFSALTFVSLAVVVLVFGRRQFFGTDRYDFLSDREKGVGGGAS